jgi:hypothetical protein
MIYAGLLALAATQTPTEFAAGVGIGVLMTDNKPYVGDLATLGDAVGSHVSESGTDRIVPILSQTCWYREPRGRWRIGLEATERWWWIWSESRSLVASSASHRVDRSVVAIDVAARLAVSTSSPLVRILVGVGPAAYWIGTRERGWFGDRDVVDVRIGVRGNAGVRIGSPHIGALFEVSLETFSVPRRNIVLADGGRAPALFLGVRIEGTL